MCTKGDRRSVTPWCLLFVLIRQGLRGGAGPQRLTRALGIETGNPVMTFEQRSSFFPSIERAPHRTTTEIPYGRWLLALALSLALPTPFFPLLVTCRHNPKLFQGGTRTQLLCGDVGGWYRMSSVFCTVYIKSLQPGRIWRYAILYQ